MKLNKHIVIGTLGLLVIGVLKHSENPNVSLSSVFIGSYVFMLALSVLDLAGGQASKLASALAMLALVNGILTQVDLSQISSFGQPSKQKGTQK